MAHAVQNFHVHAGDDDTLEVTIVEKDGTTPVDITNSEIQFFMSERAGGPAVVSKNSTDDPADFTFVDPENGRVDIVMNAADTTKRAGNHPYSIREKSQTGKLSTVLVGQIAIEATIGDSTASNETAAQTKLLADLKAAKAALVMGRLEQAVVYRDGRQIRYNETNREDLEAEIRQLEGVLGQEPPRTPAMTPFFGAP